MPNAFVDTNVLISLILASARETDCAIVYSEDLGNGQEYDGVKVVNPFVD